MVAAYKVQKFRDKWNDGAFKPSFTNPDSVERQVSRHEVNSGLRDYHDSELILKEEDWEEEMARAWICYQNEKADPNYRCRCFKD